MAWRANFIIISSAVLVVFPPRGVFAQQNSDEVLISAPRGILGSKPVQTVDLSGFDSVPPAQQSLATALSQEANIEVVPTPLQNSTLSLNGMDGEHVAIARDGDPVLGRIEGAFDARAMPLGSAQSVRVFEGLDSLPYGSENIAGTIVLESPWEVENTKQFEGAGGSLGRSSFQAKGQGVADDSRDQGWVSASSWRSNAVMNPDNPQTTLMNSVARVDGDAGAVRKNAFMLGGGRDVDARFTGYAASQNANGLLLGQDTAQNQLRYGGALDLRSESSNMRFAWNRYQSRFQELASDGTPNQDDKEMEQSFRVGPQLEENIRGTTVLAGVQGEWREVDSSRIPNGKVQETEVGPYLGARRALSDHIGVGAGLRYDSLPNVWSPRAETTYSFNSALGSHDTVLSSGLGFREVTAKERYLQFENSAVGYRVVGNPDLQTERAWMSELRHDLRSKDSEYEASVFFVHLYNAINFEPDAALGPGVWTYANIGDTQTLGLQAHWMRGFAYGLRSRLQYQYLDGKNLSTGSGLFLQPTHRISLQFGRFGDASQKGFSFFGMGTWTSRQAFVDANNNGLTDDDWIPSYWSVAAEVSYGFKFESFAKTMRVFTRMDNALNHVNTNTYPVEPRSFLAGVSADL